MPDASTIATVTYVFKRRYSDRQVTELAMRDHPTWWALTKEGGFTGEEFAYPLTFANPQGVSGTFADAQSGAEVLQGVQPKAKRRKKYGVITLDGEAMEAAKGDKGSFYDFITRHTDGIIEELGDNLAFDLFRSGNGMRGRRASIAGEVITLTDKKDVRNFKKGMTIIADDTIDGSSPRVGSAKVKKVSRSAGTVELVAGGAAAITAFANNDYLFRKGDPGTCMEGFETCTPLTAPTGGESFRGIDRTDDVELLAGSRIDDTGTLIEENLGLVAVDISTVGKKVKMGALYPTRFWEVARRMNAKVEFQHAGGNADYGFETMTIHTPGGSFKVYSDPDAPADRGRVFHPDAHVYKYLGDEVVHVIRADGKPSMRSIGSDGIEIRTRSMGNYLQYDTASHGVISI